MKSETPTVHCDGDDSECGGWAVDYYKACASTVDGVAITKAAPAPGWTTVGDEDFCPDHRPAAEGGDDQ